MSLCAYMASTAVLCFKGLPMPQEFTGQACTPNTHVRTIHGMLLHTKYKTRTVSENSRTPVDGGGGARM